MGESSARRRDGAVQREGAGSTMRPQIRRSAATLAVAACAAFGAVSAASADTIGQNFAADDPCGAHGGQFQPSYAALGAGVISSFAFQSAGDNAGQQLDFWVVRPN